MQLHQSIMYHCIKNLHQQLWFPNETVDGEFEVIHMDDNPMRPMKIKVNLSAEVKKGMSECLNANIYLFVVSLREMSDTDPNVACH